MGTQDGNGIGTSLSSPGCGAGAGYWGTGDGGSTPSLLGCGPGQPNGDGGRAFLWPGAQAFWQQRGAGHTDF